MKNGSRNIKVLNKKGYYGIIKLSKDKVRELIVCIYDRIDTHIVQGKVVHTVIKEYEPAFFNEHGQMFGITESVTTENIKYFSDFILLYDIYSEEYPYNAYDLSGKELFRGAKLKIEGIPLSREYKIISSSNKVLLDNAKLADEIF